MSATSDTLLTLGEAGDRLGVQAHRIARLFRRGLLPEPQRVGRARVVRVEDLPAIKAALQQAGYLPREDAADA